MDADIKGCLVAINKSYRAFNHKGKPMTKEQVKAVLEFGLSKGYKAVSELSNSEIRSGRLLKHLNTKEKSIKNV